MKEYLIVSMVVLILVLSVFQSIQINSLKEKLSTKSDGIDMNGWTDDEKMMYDHHGTLPARLQGGQSNMPQPSGMVGGC